MSKFKTTSTRFIADNKIPFNIRLLTKGEPYGAEMRLKHKYDAPEIEFYDTRYPFAYAFVGSEEAAKKAKAEVLGQFVARYRISTFREITGGLILVGNVPDWVLSPLDVVMVKAWIELVQPTQLPA